MPAILSDPDDVEMGCGVHRVHLSSGRLQGRNQARPPLHERAAGDDLENEELRPFEKERTPRLDLFNADGRTDLLPDHPHRASPAIRMILPPTPGLALLAMDRALADVILDEASFTAHLEHDGLDHLVHLHDGHPHVHGPQTDTYERSLKVLLAVDGDLSGDAWGTVVGQDMELVLRTSPFTDGGPLEVQVLEDGAPAQFVKVEVIQRVGQKEEPRLHAARTSASGAVSFDLDPGRWVIRATTAQSTGDNTWHSHWAAYSLFIPEVG